MTTLRFSIGTIIGPIRVCEASELIVAASAAAAKVQSTVGGGCEVLENSSGGGGMAGKRTAIELAKCSHCEYDIGLSCMCFVHQ